MPAPKDLTGQRFGKLTVLHRAEDFITKQGKHRTAWVCQCDCGNQITVLDYNLKSGSTKSCGCLRKNAIRTHREILPKQKFGKLTVLHKAENYVTKSGKHEIAWVCQCDCGNQITIRDDSLKSGNTRSCGCLHKEVMKSHREDLTGQVFGQLTVIGPAEDYILPSGYCAHRWLCQCVCGKQAIVFASSLKNGNARSCGGSHARRLGNEYDLTGEYGIGYTRKGSPSGLTRKILTISKIIPGHMIRTAMLRQKSTYLTANRERSICTCSSWVHLPRRI